MSSSGSLSYSPAGAGPPEPLVRVWTWIERRIRPELVALVVVAAVLNLWDLSRNGWANDYYAAAVRSMTMSWHNFLFASFDPSGIMTVDKPPLALWIEALSARIFGFNSWALLVPQALMGTATVALVYDLVRRPFGRVAGFVAGLTLALTPITVAISRHNNPDAALILCSVAALWFTVRAFEDGRTRWLVFAGVAVGLGFEAKMAAALLIVPGIVLAWLWVSPNTPLKTVRQLLSGGAAMVVAGGAWPLLVTLTPASDRPWIAGTADNSIWSLITGYNGAGRISGQSGGPGGAGGFGGGSTTFGGNSGLFRLLNDALGGQVGWLLGFAIVSGLGLIVLTRLRRRDPLTGWTIAIGGAFIVTAITFSLASGIFHPYYVSLLAPFSAALIGAGVYQLTRRDLHARMLGPLAIGAGLATELAVMHSESTLASLEPIVIVVAVAAAAGLALLTQPRLRLITIAVVLTALTIAPASWAVQTLGHATSSTFPAGGPASAGVGGFGAGPLTGAFGRGGTGRGFRRGPGAVIAGLFGGNARAGVPPGGAGNFGSRPGAGRGFGGGFGGFGGFGGGQSLTAVVRYANAHGGGTIAISSQSSADTEIIDNGALVAGIGGFSGNESEVTGAWLAQEVSSGKIRWVLDDGTSGFGGGFSGGRVGSRDAMAWVASACRNATTTGGSVLYDCSGRSAQILAASKS